MPGLFNNQKFLNVSVFRINFLNQKLFLLQFTGKTIETIFQYCSESDKTGENTAAELTKTSANAAQLHFEFFASIGFYLLYSPQTKNKK